MSSTTKRSRKPGAPKDPDKPPRKPRKPGAGNFLKAGRPTKAQIEMVRALAACGVNQRTIADYLGVGRKTFCTKLETCKPLQDAYRNGLAGVKEKILRKAVEKATEGKGDTIMLIYLTKALCGLSDKGDKEDEVADKAAAIRETLDKMNAGLARFTDANGEFVKEKKK